MRTPHRLLYPGTFASSWVLEPSKYSGGGCGIESEIVEPAPLAEVQKVRCRVGVEPRSPVSGQASDHSLGRDCAGEKEQSSSPGFTTD